MMNLGIDRREYFGTTEAQGRAVGDDVFGKAVETGGFEASSRGSEVFVPGLIRIDEEEERRAGKWRQRSIIACTPMIDCAAQFFIRFALLSVYFFYALPTPPAFLHMYYRSLFSYTYIHDYFTSIFVKTYTHDFNTHESSKCING